MLHYFSSYGMQLRRIKNSANRLSGQLLNMPAITSLVARDAIHTIAKRENWAAQEAGVVVVFCVVFVVAVGLIALFIHKKLQARKKAREGF
jgi:hypothetical protein